MIRENTLHPYVTKLVERIGRAGIIVGIPSFQNAKTIAHVVDAAAKGMTDNFPNLKPVIVNADGGSSDDTRDIALSTDVPNRIDKIVTKYK
ncbi:MAG: glycosyl transferase family 2, partial [Rubrobacteridae bacterium]|nr:glycosyl transferase family 2 [Rubrobacteridae bacterium]